ncbi:putative nuclear transport factor NTF-2 [Aspergillus aurantiobrunneus]
MADFTQVAEQFVKFYYQAFDADRSSLTGLYRDHSMLTFETASVQGVQAIIEKLGSLPFQKVQHQVSTFDAQPSSDQGGILVQVTGALLVDEEQKPMSYSQTFQLLPDGAGSYFVFNDIFRLIYSASA